MTIYIYKLRKNYREFDIYYCKIMKTIEIGLYFFNVIIMWGNEEEINERNNR